MTELTNERRLKIKSTLASGASHIASVNAF